MTARGLLLTISLACLSRSMVTASADTSPICVGNTFNIRNMFVLCSHHFKLVKNIYFIQKRSPGVKVGCYKI